MFHQKKRCVGHLTQNLTWIARTRMMRDDGLLMNQTQVVINDSRISEENPANKSPEFSYVCVCLVLPPANNTITIIR